MKEALWALDYVHEGFEWVDCQSSPCVFGYLRKGLKGRLLIILNFSDSDAELEAICPGSWQLLISSDWEKYGGHSREEALNGLPERLPAYSGMIFQAVGDSEKSIS